ncbi:MAG: endolytic transglycosylase MltG [Gammaproteobacteria bacterium]|nr:MAG: endolytic transglycosylase MltG [Gammaproteobacteria bacterium]
MKKAFAIIIFSLCAFIGIWFYSLGTTVVTQAKGVVYYLRPGTSKATAIADLSRQGVIPYPALFTLYTELNPHTYLKTGEYLFPKGSTPFSIWSQLTNGTGHFYHPFTIIPGWSFTQLRQALSQADGLRHLTAQKNDQQIMQSLGAVNLAPEGEFFPETYFYTRGVPDLIVLKHALDFMQKKLNEAWQQRAPDLPYRNEYEALIAASLIEKEAHLDIERPIIAGVLVNRLRKGMLLQCDPTVIYGMGSRYDGKIHKANLLENTPYNTYLHKGLPPTPIAMPSMASITAALHPQQNDYYYFVAKGDGSHQFSKTLKEHNAAVKAVR